MYKPDQELVLSYLNGDPESLDILIKRHMRPVYGLAMRFVGNRPDAEDITQEVFVRVWRNLRKFDADKSFRAWVLSITRNACIDFLRKIKEIPFVEFENEEGINKLAENIIDLSLLPPEEFERKNLNSLLRRAISGLSAKYRAVLSLRAEELTFREISQKLGEPLHTVKSRYRRALLMLKNILIDSPLHQE